MYLALGQVFLGQSGSARRQLLDVASPQIYIIHVVQLWLHGYPRGCTKLGMNLQYVASVRYLLGSYCRRRLEGSRTEDQEEIRYVYCIHMRADDLMRRNRDNGACGEITANRTTPSCNQLARTQHVDYYY